ncbi:hypothetical protein D6853_12845 [Butyrivibrio sp. X503]|uniref:hypothetical protein n=1 Tax=Butyrivibrio sp. X503 TaxID=2364878 RepID=UPI000EA8BB4B|nr:hypothetical protein [Butyrivibrio sp. X503]RKM54720.1 hypothetical protein D6853_12845 [Butyrivibrio sp. X503]
MYNSQGDSMILSVCERKSFLQRPDQAKTGVMQYMAANVDYLFIVTSLNEDYNYNRIASGELSAERYELYKNLGKENTKNYAMKKEISKWAKAYKKNNKRNMWD